MNLERFVKAQEHSYGNALREIKMGRKSSHWVWYIYPQIKGLGHSYNARYYAINDLDEARAYVEHSILNARLREITSELLNHKEVEIEQLMGSVIDAVKLRSSMTLFDAVSPDDIYNNVLDVFFEGKRCSRTLTMLKKF